MAEPASDMEREAREALRCLFIAVRFDVAADVEKKALACIDALRAENADLRAAFTATDRGDGDYTPYAELAVDLTRAQKENAELRARAEKAEFVIKQHDLCHDMHGHVDAEAFAQGCAAEQREIYGHAPHVERIADLEAQLAAANARAEKAEKERA